MEKKLSENEQWEKLERRLERGEAFRFWGVIGATIATWAFIMYLGTHPKTNPEPTPVRQEQTYKVTNQEYEKQFKKLDRDNNGCLNINEFLSLYRK